MSSPWHRTYGSSICTTSLAQNFVERILIFADYLHTHTHTRTILVNIVLPRIFEYARHDDMTSSTAVKGECVRSWDYK